MFIANVFRVVLPYPGGYNPVVGIFLYLLFPILIFFQNRISKSLGYSKWFSYVFFFFWMVAWFCLVYLSIACILLQPGDDK